jgi:hypothetical protein
VIYKAQNQYHVVMEVAPEFRQSPEILNQIYISTGGGNVSGMQKTQPLPGIVAAKARIAKSGAAPAGSGQSAGDAARNAASNALATTGRSTTSTGSAVSTAKETMVPLSAFTRFDRGNAAIAVYHQDLFAASTISFKSRSRRLVELGYGGDRRSDAPARCADFDPRRFCWHCENVSAIARQRAPANCRRIANRSCSACSTRAMRS